MFIRSFCQSTMKKSSIFVRQIHVQQAQSIVNRSTGSISTALKGNGTIQRYLSNETMPSQNAPSLEVAKSMQTNYMAMDNQGLVLLANIDSPPVTGAREEVLKRHIMSVDEVDYQTACKIFSKIETENKQIYSSNVLPYKIGIFTATTAGLASFPLCFDLGTAKWFNTYFVTTDVPEPADLETLLEVGSWTWNWMEPPLGQISFFLLCLQFSRAQLQNLGIKPYTEKIKTLRAGKLCASFDRYDKDIISAYSESIGFSHE